MMPFYLAAAAILAVALLLLLRPWLHKPNRATPPSDALQTLNTAVHRDRLAELDRDLANGVLSTTDHAEARDELQRQLLDDTANSDAATPTTASRKTAIVLALLLPVLGISLYLLLGSPSAVLSADEQARRANAAMEKMVTELAQKLEKEPSNTEGWIMLARSYKAMERWQDAEQAYQRIGPGLQKNATLLADLAEVIAQQTRSFEGRPRELLQQALKLDPNNLQALLLGGTDLFENERYREAAALWEHLLKQLEPGSEDAQSIEAGIARAREFATQSGKGKAKIDTKSDTKSDTKVDAQTTVKAAAKKAVSGRVELSPALRDKAQPNDVIFVFARAVNADGTPGARMPLAAQRARVADLPLTFTLDDSQAISPEAVISTAATVRVEARISRSGNATPGKGDLTGKSAVVKPGAKNLHILIDSIAE
jgi:cytochrome c-type biogenesis protein CcmH